MSNRTSPASRSSSSRSPILTPSSTTFTFGGQRASSQPFNFGVRTGSNRATPDPSSTASRTPQFTPSSTPSTFGEERASTPSFAFGNNPDPDRPLPSVERFDFSASSHQSTPSTIVYTPSTSTEAASTRQSPEPAPSLREFGVDFRDFRLTSRRVSESTSSRHGTPTPSIHVTPSAPLDGTSRPRANRTESIINGIDALNVESIRGDPPDASGRRDNHSASPSRRRRSGSGINREPPHQVEDEVPPDALFYRREVRDALANARNLTSRMATVLSSSYLHREHGSSIERLHRQATRLSRFQLPPSQIVGLVGDSGAGKSSLINSLLDKEGLARASDSGSACTCAVTEYLFHDRDDLIIHIDLFSLEELKNQFEELLRAYRDYEALPSNSSGRDQVGEENSDRRRLELTAGLARETFQASFGESLEQTPTLLSSMPFEDAVRTMIAWASELCPQQTGSESFSTVEACSSRLRDLTSESNVSTPNGAPRVRWPFIQKLRVYLRASILSRGLIIADLPGLRDLNSARKAVTERYVRQCQQIFIVAGIGRATTDESIQEIFNLGRRANLSKIDVVCTRSEFEAPEMREARHDYPEQGAAIEELQRQIDADKETIDSLTEEIQEYDQDDTDPDLTQEEMRQLRRLKRDCREAKRSMENKEFDLLRLVMNLRNTKVSDGLLERYRNDTNTPTLKIFCVGNHMYWDKRHQPVTVALPYLNLSGILELRRYCIGIVAESHLRATREYIRNEIPAFLGSVELWVEAGSGNASAEGRQQVLDALSTIQRELDELKSPVSPLNNLSLSLRQQYNTQIHQRMAAGQRGGQWTAHANRASLDWQGWHHSTYKAFCSNYGDHSTPKMPHRCWNEEAMGGMTGDMSTVWEGFVVEITSDLDRIDGAVIEAFDNVFNVALSIDANQPGGADARTAMRTLAATLRHRKSLTLDGIEEACEGFRSELSSLHTDAFSSIRTAFIGKLMESTYHAANMEYGSGSDRRRKDLITGKFGSPALFILHRRNCKEMFRDIARGLQVKAKDIVNEQIGFVEADLQMLRDENAVLESEREPEFRRTVGAEVERARREVEGFARVVEDVS